MSNKDTGATHEMIPMHCLSTPRQEACLSFHPWPTHQNPRAFWPAEATNINSKITSLPPFQFTIYYVNRFTVQTQTYSCHE